MKHISKPDNFMENKIVFRNVSNMDCWEVKPETIKWVVLRYLRRSLQEFLVGKKLLNKLCNRFVNPAKYDPENERLISGQELHRLTELRTKEVAKRFPRRFYNGVEFIGEEK